MMKKLRLTSLSLIIGLFAPLVVQLPVSAASASLRLNAPQRAQINEQIAVELAVNSQEVVSAVEVRVNFSDNLSFVGFDLTNSVFTNEVNSETGDGEIIFTRTSPSAQSGNQRVVTLLFNADESGQATVSIANSSNAASTNGEELTLNTPTASINISNEQAETNTQELAISEVGEESVGYKQAVLNALTNQDASVFVKYGIEADDLNYTASSPIESTSHRIALNESVLELGTTYYYQVVAVSSGDYAESEVSSLTTKGVTVSLILTDAEGLPLSNVDVTLAETGDSVESDDNGQAVFENLATGSYSVYVGNATDDTRAIFVEGEVVSQPGRDANGNVVVTETVAPVQFQLSFDYQPTTNPLVRALVVAGLLALVVGLGYAIFKIRYDRQISTMTNETKSPGDKSDQPKAS